MSAAGAAAAGGTSRLAPKRSRRPRLSALALGGAASAAAYGHFVLAMHLGPPLVMVGLGGMTLALCAAALWRVIDPLTRDEIIVQPEARAPHRIRELEREKQAVLKAIKEIELDHQMRKISDTDYREMVERYRARALRVLGDLAAGDDYRALIERELRDRLAARAAASTSGSAPDTRRVEESLAAAHAAAHATAIDETSAQAGASASTKAPDGDADTSAQPLGGAGPRCRSCGASNDGDAQFCKKCGTKLMVSADLG